MNFRDLPLILANVGDLTAPFMMKNEEVIISSELLGEVRDAGFDRGA